MWNQLQVTYYCKTEQRRIFFVSFIVFVDKGKLTNSSYNGYGNFLHAKRYIRRAVHGQHADIYLVSYLVLATPPLSPFSPPAAPASLGPAQPELAPHLLRHLATRFRALYS